MSDQNNPSWARGAIDLSSLDDVDLSGEPDTDSRHDRDVAALNVSQARARLVTQRANAIQNRHLPKAPRVLFPKDHSVDPFDQQVQDNYLESIIGLRVAQINDNVDAYDNDSLVGFVDEEYSTFTEEWLESNQTENEDASHKKRRNRSLGAHAAANTIGAALAGVGAYTAGANTLTAITATVGAGTAALLTKDAAMRQDEFPAIHDLGDKGIANEGSSSNIKKIGTLKNKASDEEKNRSVRTDIAKNLKSFGFSDNAQPTFDDIRTITEKRLNKLNQLESDKPNKSPYRTKMIEIANDIMSFTSIAALDEENLVRLRVRTAIKLHSLELETHDSKKFNTWKLRKRLASAAFAGFIGVFATVSPALHYNDEQRQEQIEKKQKTPYENPGTVKDDGDLPQDEQDSREEDAYDNLGN